MPEHATPHDKLFKGVFSIPENALAVFRAAFPPAVIDAIDPGSLELVPATFVDEALRGRESDLVFRVRLRGREAFVYVLFEHQSTPDGLMPFRLLRYLVLFWEGWLAEHRGAEELPLVIPLVLFQGPGTWTGPRSLAELIECPAELERYVPVFPITFEELGVVPRETLAALAGPPAARLALLVMRAVRAGEDVLDVLERELVRQAIGSERGLRMVFRYTLRVRGATREAVERMSRMLEGEPGFKSLEQYLIDQGPAQGREAGAVQAARRLLEKQLRARFRSLAPDVVARLEQASLAELELWAERVVTVSTIEDVFRA